MSKVVTLSEAATIAIHAMVLVGGSKGNINVNKISELTGASKNHLAKVMQRLVKEKLIRSTRGPSGGFVLNKDASQIDLLTVYEAIEGTISLDDCPFDSRVCPVPNCIMGGIVHKLTREFRDYLKSQTISILVNAQDI